MVNLCGLVNLIILKNGKLAKPSGFDEYKVVKGHPVGYPVCVIGTEETGPLGAEACLKRVIPPGANAYVSGNVDLVARRVPVQFYKIKE